MRWARWARNYECCKECNTTSSKHSAKGLCTSCYDKRYRLKNEEHLRSQFKKRYWGNRETSLHKNKEWRLKNKEHVRRYKRKQDKKWYQKNRDTILNKRCKYHNENKEHLNEQSRKYYYEVGKERNDLHYYGGNRTKVLERDRYRCVECNSKRRLVVHHIDGKSKHNVGPEEVDNNLDNLTTMCRSCHRKIHHEPGRLAV